MELKKLFVEAIQGGTMEGFFKLISYFQTQSEPAYCGLASLAMVLNALAVDPGRKWKGDLNFSLVKLLMFISTLSWSTAYTYAVYRFLYISLSSIYMYVCSASILDVALKLDIVICVDPTYRCTTSNVAQTIN